METVLYDVNQKRKKGLKAVHQRTTADDGIKAGVGRLLVLGWGIVCRAGALSSFRKPERAIGIANGLIILSLSGLILTFYPVIQVELAYRLKKVKQNQPTVARAYFGDLLNSTSEVSFLSAPDPNFSIVIPKIDAQAKIIANVDPTSSKIYDQALKAGVAQAAGWGFPGMGETVWLFAHSTDAPWNVARYNAVFYLLRELEPGDQVIVFFNQRRFNYQVFDKMIAEASDASFLENNGEERLVLQTCWPPGTSLKRLIVLAKPLDH